MTYGRHLDVLPGRKSATSRRGYLPIMFHRSVSTTACYESTRRRFSNRLSTKVRLVIRLRSDWQAVRCSCNKLIGFVHDSVIGCCDIDFSVTACQTPVGYFSTHCRIDFCRPDRTSSREKTKGISFSQDITQGLRICSNHNRAAHINSRTYKFGLDSWCNECLGDCSCRCETNADGN